MPSASRSFAVFGRGVRAWWTEPVDYAAHVQYFAKRSMSDAVRLIIAGGTGLIAVISLAILLPWAGHRSIPSRFDAGSFAALMTFWAAVWCCRPWPARPTSLAHVISCDIGIALLAVHDPSWFTGLFAINAFALISVYLVFFDGPKVLVLHLLWILVSTTVFAVRTGPDPSLGGVVFAASTLAAVAPVVVTPLGIQFGIWTLRNDANDSITDPLTGLLNRRGLYLHFDELLCGQAQGGCLAVMVVDLDSFKRINDEFGHAVGDEVLNRCAKRIKSALRGSALVARVGGEEFVIVEVSEPVHTRRIAERIRSAVGAPAVHAPVTASIGVAHVPLTTFTAPGADAAALLDRVISHADHAMLDAKRNGGNTTTHLSPIDWDSWFRAEGP